MKFANEEKKSLFLDECPGDDALLLLASKYARIASHRGRWEGRCG